MLNIYIIRHAESLGNVNNHLIGGQSNHFPLTERGEEQANLLGSRLKQEGFQFDHVYASIAVRAKSTAEIACSHLNIPTRAIIPTDKLVELSQGDWEGKVRKEIYTPEKRADIRQDPYDFKAPNGESQREVEARMRAWLEEAVSHYNGVTNLNIAAFSHGFAIKTLIRNILQSDPMMTYRIIIHNTSITCLQYNGKFWYMERINDFLHLAGREFIGHYG